MQNTRMHKKLGYRSERHPESAHHKWQQIGQCYSWTWQLLLSRYRSSSELGNGTKSLQGADPSAPENKLRSSSEFSALRDFRSTLWILSISQHENELSLLMDGMEGLNEVKAVRSSLDRWAESNGGVWQQVLVGVTCGRWPTPALLEVSLPTPK